MAPRRQSSAYRRDPPDFDYSGAGSVEVLNRRAHLGPFHSGHARPSGKPDAPARRPRTTAATAASLRAVPFAQCQKRHRRIDRPQRVVPTDVCHCASQPGIGNFPGPSSTAPRLGAPTLRSFGRAGCRDLRPADSRRIGGAARSVRVRGRRRSTLQAPCGPPEPRISRLLRLQPLDLHPQSHHQQPASGPLTRDIVAYDTLVSVVSPFHRPRPVGEERRTMILPCTGS